MALGAVIWLLVAILYFPASDRLFETEAPAVPALTPAAEKAAVPAEPKEDLKDSLKPIPRPIPVPPGVAGRLPAPVPKRAVKRLRRAKRKPRPSRRRRSRFDRGADIRLFSVAAARGFGSKRRFVVRGSVFELGTLAPLRGAELRFLEARTGKIFKAYTGADGAYDRELPASMDGYFLSIRMRGFSPKYLEDWMPSLRTFARKKRSEAAALHLGRPLETRLILHRPGEYVDQDYALIRR